MNKRGFTLIEVLAVIVLISIISFIAIPNILSAIYESKNEQCKTNIKILEKYLKLYAEDTNLSNGRVTYNNLIAKFPNIDLKGETTVTLLNYMGDPSVVITCNGSQFSN